MLETAAMVAIIGLTALAVRLWVLFEPRLKRRWHNPAVSTEIRGATKEHVKLVCDGCGTQNRVPVAKLTQRPICGGCKKGLL